MYNFKKQSPRIQKSCSKHVLSNERRHTLISQKKSPLKDPKMKKSMKKIQNSTAKLKNICKFYTWKDLLGSTKRSGNYF